MAEMAIMKINPVTPNGVRHDLAPFHNNLAPGGIIIFPRVMLFGDSDF